MQTILRVSMLSFVAVCCVPARAAEAPALTSLSAPADSYQVPAKPYVVLKRGEIEAVVVDNRGVDDAILPGHHGSYNGLASLKHARRPENIFVPAFSGLNLEHIHDGTEQKPHVLFEPRYAPMELRVIDSLTADLYQKPTPHYGLESCLRYRMLEDGVIEMAFECIPRQQNFENGYVGLFWASYIHQPESLDIHFKGHPADQVAPAQWIRGATPSHGALSTHLATDDRREFAHAPKFPLTLVFNFSRYRYSEPWCYGVSHGMALVYMFRPRDQIRISQSPSGGGARNPAWDFQFLIPDYKVGQRYQMLMRTMYLPYESPEQIERVTQPHRSALKD